jgi:hypothetical protein
LCNFFANLTPFKDVGFGADKHDSDMFCRVIFYFLEPFMQILKGLRVGDIKDQKCDN